MAGGAGLGRAWHGKAGQGKARQGRQGGARQGMARQGMAGEEKEAHSMNSGTLLAQIEQLNRRIDDMRTQARAAAESARTVATFSSLLAELPELTTRIEEALAAAKPTEWMSTQEAATYMGVSAKLVSQMVAAGDLPGYKVGERYRFDRHEIDQAIKEFRL